jgi:multicomponent Na+:H+ antiporter subunit B
MERLEEVLAGVPVELVLFVLLASVAVVIARLKDLFAAALLAGIYSLLSAGLFTLMDAVDVAFTEAAVGAGVTTVLFLGALSVTSRQENQQPWRLRPLLVVVLTGAALVYASFDLPSYGDPGAPIHHHIAPDYIEGVAHEIHIPNVVTGVLASYRGYDTLGETVVILTAAVGVMMLLGWPGARPASAWAEPAAAGAAPPAGGKSPLPMREKVILRTAGRLMIPFILLFALYVQFHGDFGPGGGFQAGVIFAAGLVLFGLLFGVDAADRVLPAPVAERLIAVGVLLYGGVGVVNMLLGGSFLDYDTLSEAHGQHYGILLVEAGVGLAVAATMTRLFYAFASLAGARSGATEG